MFWDPRKDNGLGDVEIREIDLLKLFWEPGVTDLQKSRNLFIVDLVDEDLLEQQYPQHRGRLGGKSIDLKQYLYDDTVDTQGKSLVVDWYYKTRGASGAPLLQYVKFVGDTVLFSSEDCRAPDGTYPYRETGWYEDGEYPVVLDTLFPEKGTPVGFGYVAVCKDPQLYIDKLFGNILDYSMKATRPRAFVSQSTGVNEEEYLDWNKPLVHVEGELDERRLKQITLSGLDGVYVNVLQMKIEEMKDTASNRDVNAGSASGGVTAASAIAALQEAGSKVSRDMIAASYRAYCRINALCISRMRQFYDEARAFRITGSDGGWRFVDFSNRAIRDQPLAGEGAGETLYRRPVFDLKIRSRKRSPFSRMEQNEQAKELYKLGFFDPQRAQEALAALDMMDFEGVDAVRERVREGKSLLDLLEQMSRSLAALTGGAGEQPAASAPAAASDAGQSAGGGRSPVPAPPTESYAAGLARRTAAGAGET